MPFASLRDFIDRPRSARPSWCGCSEPVSPVLEMTEIQTRLLAEGGPAVLFENVVRADGERYDMPVLVNLFGTVERVAWGMDREPRPSCARSARRWPSCSSPSRPAAGARRWRCCRWSRP